MLPKMLPAIALACLLAGCACTTKPLVLPPPPPKLLPLPPELARLPEAPPPLTPGYGRVMVSPEDLLAHARDYGGYCRNLRAQAKALLAVEKGREVRP